MKCLIKPCPGRVLTLPNRSGSEGRPENRSPNHAAVAGESQRSPRRCVWLGDASLRVGGGRAAGLDRLPTRGWLRSVVARFWLEVFWSVGLNPVEDQYGALPFMFGTIVSSLLSLVIAVPLSLGVAVFITEMCPTGLRGILSFTTELLAAIPSVVYGLWAIFVMVPYCANMCSRFWPRRSAGRDCSPVRPTASVCWRRA